VPTTGWATDFTRHTVSLSEIASGGPAKDGIPPVDAPVLTTVSEAAEWIEAREPVVELVVNGQARAYPLQILVWHEIVNDELAGVPVAVTFCPLCYTAVVFDRRLDGKTYDFGTTGNLRHSDLVMYDRQTETWWQQFAGEGIVGELAGRRLTTLPARIVSFGDFAARHPDAEVLSRDTGFDRPYGENPYVGYDEVGSPPWFPAASEDDDRLQPKQRVVYVEAGDDAVAVPFPALERAGTIGLEVGGTALEIRWVAGVRSALDEAELAASAERGSADVRDAVTGEPVAFDTPFWFAVAAFRPDVRIVTG
jgi:hypothetical protein